MKHHPTRYRGKKRYTHWVPSNKKRVTSNVKLIRRLNNEFNLSIPENIKVVYNNRGASKKSEGWFFEFWFWYDSKWWGATECITKVLKYKKYELYTEGKEYEIVESNI